MNTLNTPPKASKPSLLLLPWIVGFCGIASSILLFLAIRNNLAHYFDLLKQYDHLIPWIVLALSASLSVLLGLSIRTLLLERWHSKMLDLVNAQLRNEIKEKQQANEYKINMERSLHHNQKLQAIGTLAGGIAHDFNNLLYAIVGYVEMAKEDTAKNTTTHENLGKVLEAAKRGQELIARILNFSRQQHHTVLEPIELKATVDAALSLLQRTVPASIHLRLEARNQQLWINGNQNQLHQVLVNLINNAVDATDEIGDVIIRLSDRVDKDLTKTRLQGPYCAIEITDTGVGMDETTLARIFEPFFTTKEVGKGTGLGLAMVHSIMEAHQGHILVDSQFGHGTTFTLIFPKLENTGT